MRDLFGGPDERISDTHQLVDRKPDVALTRCGASVKLRREFPLPSSVTGWQSEVTCGACLASR